MIYTSYFSKTKKILEMGLRPVAITAGKPKFFNGEHFGEVGPQRPLLNDYKNGIINEEQYTEIYNKFLEYNKEEIISIVKERYISGNVVFLCYEGPGKFCHRHLLSEFLNKNNIKCEELKI